MLPNEGGHGIQFDLWWLETAVLVGHDNELVTSNSLTIIVQTYIRRIALAVTFVKRVACVLQYFFDVYTASVVCKCLFVCHLSYVYIVVYLP